MPFLFDIKHGLFRRKEWGLLMQEYESFGMGFLERDNQFWGILVLWLTSDLCMSCESQAGFEWYYLISAFRLRPLQKSDQIFYLFLLLSMKREASTGGRQTFCRSDLLLGLSTEVSLIRLLTISSPLLLCFLFSPPLVHLRSACLLWAEDVSVIQKNRKHTSDTQVQLEPVPYRSYIKE